MHIGKTEPLCIPLPLADTCARSGCMHDARKVSATHSNIAVKLNDVHGPVATYVNMSVFFYDRQTRTPTSLSLPSQTLRLQKASHTQATCTTGTAPGARHGYDIHSRMTPPPKMHHAQENKPPPCQHILAMACANQFPHTCQQHCTSPDLRI